MPDTLPSAATAVREPPLSVRYADERAAAAALASDRLLALVRFGGGPAATDGRVVTVPLPSAIDEPAPCELWTSPAPVRTGRHGPMAFACNEHVLFGHLALDEGSYRDIAAATYAAYRALLEGIAAAGFPHPLRIWNHFADINADETRLERYQAFCRGRHLAMARAGTLIVGRLPAASAIGSTGTGRAGGQGIISVLAAKSAGVPLENPRQISAFRYPRQYGPKSPLFSRAMLVPWRAGERHLFVSGTASIVGHASRHASDIAQQRAETLDNLEALLAAAGRQFDRRFRFRLLRVYVRDPGHGPDSRAAVLARLGGDVPVVLLAGDICRRELLIEAEGVAVAAD